MASILLPSWQTVSLAVTTKSIWGNFLSQVNVSRFSVTRCQAQVIR